MESDEQGSGAPGAALLLIVGEPLSEAHRDAIFTEITKGFKCWDVEETGININTELAQIANKASLGQDGPNVSNKPGEKVIQHQSENLAVEILINPLAQTVKNSIKKLLVVSSPIKYIIYAGHAFQGSGAWILQDDTFVFNSLAQVLKNVEVETALKQNFEANLTIHTPVTDSNWGSAISRADATNSLRIQLNPPARLEDVHGVVQFVAYVGGFVKATPITSLLKASEQFGNISFSRPTLYIFPGCQGDSLLFGISGFNLLVNGGYNRRACFWDFARHLDRVDAMLMTHLDSDNLFGLSAVLQRKLLDNIHPQIGYLYFNAIDKPGVLSTAPSESDNEKSLLVNLSEEASKMTQMAKQLGINPHPCVQKANATTCEPINLYHKLGHGSLDMYVLSPVADSKELKEFFQAWAKQSASMGNSGPFPLQNVLSVCTLLVWKPYNYDEKIVRIFFPGNCPQHKVIEGLEKMKAFAFLKHASCTAKDLMKPVAVKKPAGKAGASQTKTTSSRPARAENGRAAGTATTRTESPRKTASTTSRSTASAPTASRTSARPSKDDAAKKTSRTTQSVTKLEDKDKKTTSKPRPPSASTRPASVSTSSSKAPTSPRKAPTQTKPASSKSPSPPKPSSPTKSPSPPKLSPAKSPTKAKTPSSPVKQPDVEQVPKVEAKTTESNVEQVHDNEVNKQADVQNAAPVQSEPLISLKTEDSPVDVTSAVMTNSMSAAGDAPKPNDLEVQKLQANGESIETDFEEVKPQALPEPQVMAHTPGQEQVSLPDYTSKIENDQQELSEFSKAEEELQVLVDEEDASSSFTDPAQQIPPSPEPSQREQADEPCVQPVVPKSSFETPVFTEETSHTAGCHQEQSIQYGIADKSRAHDMGGIQEVDEEEEDGSEPGSTTNPQNDKEALQEMGIYDIDDSAELQTDDGKAVDEGIGEEDSSLPAAFDRDSSPETVNSTSKDIDKDSIDGEMPDCDKDIDESALYHMNGNGNKEGHEDLSALKNQSEINNAGAGDGSEDIPSFDPLQQWGQPMGLPSPPPPSSGGRSGATSPTKSRPSSAFTRTGTSARNGSDDASKKRPATAPTSARGAPSRPGAATSRRTGTAGSSRNSPASSKVPALPPMTPFYVDLTYVPCHGDPAYSDVEFFKRVRARYYVLSTMCPSPQVLDALLEGKSTWEQKDLEVTLIPTYDNDTLRHWMGLNKERLQELRVDMTPAVSRCTIQLQDLETSLPAYRLEV